MCMRMCMCVCLSSAGVDDTALSVFSLSLGWCSLSSKNEEVGACVSGSPSSPSPLCLSVCMPEAVCIPTSSLDLLSLSLTPTVALRCLSCCFIRSSKTKHYFGVVVSPVLFFPRFFLFFVSWLTPSPTSPPLKAMCLCACVCIYIYIHVYVELHRAV